jgi:hypothetical protein
VELLDFTLTGDAVLGLDPRMTEDRLPLNELLRKAGDGDFLRAVAESVLQLLIEADVERLIGAGRDERAAERMTWRNGFRDRAPASVDAASSHHVLAGGCRGLQQAAQLARV